MMNTLLLLRHAKSDWSHPALGDFDRPLNKRGQKAAPLIGKEIRRRGLVPQRVYCSAARRAQETWEAVSKVIAEDPAQIKVKVQRGLYLASPAQIMTQLRRAPKDADCVMLIAHNPGMENLAHRLADEESEATAFNRLVENFPTAALAVFECPIETWQALDWQQARLTHCLWPRELC